MRAVALLGDWHDAGRGEQRHEAQDIMAPRGTPVLSPVRGTVAFVGETTQGGYNVRLRTTSGTVQLSHFDAPPMVEQGERVTVGQQLGVVGNSGQRASRTCPHLHIGARDRQGRAINLYDELRALRPPTVSRPDGRPTPAPRPSVRQREVSRRTNLLAGVVLLGVAVAVATDPSDRPDFSGLFKRRT